MNMQNQTEPVVFKLWMLYFQKDISRLFIYVAQKQENKQD